MLNIFLGIAHIWQLNYQNPASTGMFGLITLNYYIYIYLIIILIAVSLILKYTLDIFYFKYKIGNCQFNHAQTLEIVWTLIPSIILVFIAIPSFSLLYQMEKFGTPFQTIKIVGHQWYWSYQYADYSKSEFTSYIKATDDLASGDFRLLEVDTPLVLPIKHKIKFVITSNDVIHSWAVPALGIKVDAVPGRLSQYSLSILKEGVYYGQCSEICGVDHGFMPIKVIAVNNYDLTKVLVSYFGIESNINN